MNDLLLFFVMREGKRLERIEDYSHLQNRCFSGRSAIQQPRISVAQHLPDLSPAKESRAGRWQLEALLVKPPQSRYPGVSSSLGKVAGFVSETLPRPSLVRQQQWQTACGGLMRREAPVFIAAHQNVTAGTP